MGAILDFLAAFTRDYEKYLSIEKEVRALCEDALRGIQFLWQSRVKAVESLEKKLRDRSENYKGESENVADVVDLVAARIILADWRNLDSVEGILMEQFIFRNKIQHPKPGQTRVNPHSRFRGYGALHFHVKRKNGPDQHSGDPVIEIQVMTAYMWAYSTVAHDIEYKKLSGDSSEDLVSSLEMLKGIANLGEIGLEMFDRHFVPAARLSPQQNEIKPESHATMRTVAAKLGLDEDDKNCLRDLGAGLTDPRDDRKRIERHKDRLQEGLCSWVLKDPAFFDWWTYDDFPFLWIHGEPGKGKTMMMMALIDEVVKRLRDRPGSNVVAYFFCESTNPKLNTTVSVLKGLIFQLVDQEKTLISHLRKRYDSNGAKIFDDENTLDVLLEILSNIMKDQSLGSVYFMVDALDECDAEISELLQRIIDESLKISPKIKLLTTSRNELAFMEQLGYGHQRRTSLESNTIHVTRAVADFIYYKVKELAREKSYASELQEFVRESLLQKSEGTFLWVALVCKELSKVRKQYAKSLIEEIPVGLRPLYARMLNKVLSQESKTDIELCQQILCSVVTAFRPLRLEEIAVFAKISDEFRKDPSDLKELVRLCGSFITVRGDTVFLVHQSAKDFLSDRERKGIFPSGQEHEHANKARLCLEIMSNTLRKNICDFEWAGIRIEDVSRSRINAHLPFHAQYACLYWVDHLQQASASELSTLLWLEGCQVDKFLQRHFLHWLEVLCLMERFLEARLAISSLGNIRSRMNADLSSFVSSASDFLDEFSSIIWREPLQIYNSALVFSPETSIIKRLCTHDWPSWIEKLSINEETSVTDIITAVFSPNGQLLAVVSPYEVILWDPIKKISVSTLKSHQDSFIDVVFAPGGQLLASRSWALIDLWDPFTGTLLRTLKGHSKRVETVTFSPDGLLLASGSDDNTVRLWNSFTGESLHTFKGHSKIVTTVVFSPNGQCLASGSNDKTVRLWNSLTGESLRTLEGHSKGVITVVFSPNGQLLASGSDDRTIRLWEAETGQEIERIKGNYGGEMSFSKDGSQLKSKRELIPSSFLSKSPHSPVVLDSPYSLSLRGEWIVYKGSKVLRVPKQVMAIVLRDNNLVLCGSDRPDLYQITILRFNPMNALF